MAINGTGPEAAQSFTREELLSEETEKTLEAAQPGDEPEELAEAQEEKEQSEKQEAALGRMKLNEFLNAAGVSMEEFYRDVYVERDGKEVPISQAWDEHASLKTAHDALLRERHELQEKLNQNAVQVPQGNISPEAQALLSQAQIYQQALTTTDWSKVDPAQAANSRLELMTAAQTLQAQAQQKQQEWVTEQQQKWTQAQSEADRQTRSRIPEWSDAQVMATEWRSIRDMAKGYGLQDAELDQIYDPRVKQMLRDAWKAMTNQKRVTEGAKRIRKVSKTLASGSRESGPGKADLKDVAKQIRNAKSKEEKQRLRLELPLGD